MKFITFKQDAKITDGGVQQLIQADPGALSPKNVWATTDNFYYMVKDQCEVVTTQTVQKPRQFNIHEAITATANPIRIIVMNALGTGIGDALCGSIALEKLYLYLLEHGKQPVFDFLLREGRIIKYAELFRLSPYVSKIHPGMMPMTEYMDHHFELNNEIVVGGDQFEELHMVDWWLKEHELNYKDYGIKRRVCDRRTKIKGWIIIAFLIILLSIYSYVITQYPPY